MTKGQRKLHKQGNVIRKTRLALIEHLRRKNKQKPNNGN